MENEKSFSVVEQLIGYGKDEAVRFLSTDLSPILLLNKD